MDAATREKALAPANMERRSMQFLMPSWGGLISVQALNEDEFEQFGRESMRRVKARKGNKSVLMRSRPRVLIATIHTLDGQPLFKPDDEEAIAKQLPNIPKKLIDLAMEMAGFSDEEADELDEGN